MGACFASNTVTVAASGTVSGALDIGLDAQVVAFVTPAALTSTAMTLQASTTLGGTYNAVHAAGAAISFTVAADRYVVMTTAQMDALKGCRFIKLVMGSAEAAARTIEVVYRG